VFQEKKIELKENLIVELEEKKRNIENERNSMELTGGEYGSRPSIVCCWIQC
jgi:Sin3 histone deacetylase corepressor complex component SDS3